MSIERSTTREDAPAPAAGHSCSNDTGRLSALPRRLAVGALVGLIRLYQWTLSPVLGGQCRYWPTCSHYGVEALRTHGPFRGTWMTIARVVRCHPFAKGGYDPVPPRER